MTMDLLDSKPIPILKILAMFKHVAIVVAILGLGKYMTALDMSDKEAAWPKYFADIGLQQEVCSHCSYCSHQKM